MNGRFGLFNCPRNELRSNQGIDVDLTSLCSPRVDNETFCTLGYIKRKDLDCRKDGFVVQIGLLESVGIGSSLIIWWLVEGLGRIEASQSRVLGEQCVGAHWCFGTEIRES